MLEHCEWSKDGYYKTGSLNEPLQFYLEGLANSKEFNLLLGYFSSSAINLLSLGFATFISRGGVMRLVINHLLSEKDKGFIQTASSGTVNTTFDLTDITSLQRVLNEYDTHFFECLAYLLSIKRIQIKIIKPKNGKGIAHYKSGVFGDGVNYVGYKASCNFTLYGLSENLEELEAFFSWQDVRSVNLIDRQNKLIDAYFAETEDDVEYLSEDEIETKLTEAYGNKSLNELLVNEQKLIKARQKLKNANKSLQISLNKLNETIQRITERPIFPYEKGPRAYQIDAYNRWVDNNYTGIFAMATGTGKTITALNCLLNEYNANGYYRAVITVPTISLVEQWSKECSKFNYKNIIIINSKEKWEQNLSFFTTASKLIETSFIVIVTYSSLTKEKFQAYFKLLPQDTILIADETHNLGSPKLLNNLHQIHLSKRIGLSATPQRKYDDTGNNAINRFFDDSAPYIVSLSMADALKNEWLCNFTYHPHIVRLSESEIQKYMEITLQLLRMGIYDKASRTYRSTPAIEYKLLERKRIIHKAENKLTVFNEIIKEEFKSRNNLKYTLVYVPEGIESRFDTIDVAIEDESEIKLINEYTKVVSQIDESITVKQFTAKTSDRSKIMKDYEDGKIHVLTSMKCLDEGIDVPRSELAIFCASTGNPRQFVQRRGRVLRLHKDKIHATIHDLVVVPTVIDDKSYDIEKSLLKKELERVVDFAKLSINKTKTYEVLKSTLDFYNLNLYE